MSKVFDLEQTSIPSQYSINVRDNISAAWADANTAMLYRILFTNIGDTLRFYQSKNVDSVGLSIKDDKGNFKMGAILNYKKPEDGSDDDTGNWYLEMTFDEKDMEDVKELHDNHSDVFIRSAAYAAGESGSRFKSTDIMYNMYNIAIDTLVQFLDANASETEEVDVRLRGVFTASVVIENGQKIMSIVPGESIKQIIKNDAGL